MPAFTPPTQLESTSDSFFGRYKIPVGQTVILRDGHYVTSPYPWLGEIAPLSEGTEYFLGGRTYQISNDVADALVADGYEVVTGIGFGEDEFGDEEFGA